MLLKDRHGNIVSEDEARELLRRERVGKPRGRSEPEPSGYIAPPGTGPAGETCGSCQHLVRVRFAKVYPKCGLARAFWTGGRRTDVLVRSPACKRWQALDGAE